MPAKTYKYLLTLLTIIFLGLSLLLGVRLVLERQLISKKAATPAGTTSLTTSGPSVQVGANLPVTVTLHTTSTPNSKGITIVRALFNYNPDNVVSQPTVQLNLPGFAFSFAPEITTTTIKVEAYYPAAGPEGYIPTGDVNFVTLNFPTLNPGTFTVSFDPDLTQSLVISKDGTQDILLSPLPTNTFTVLAAPTLTPTPTQPAATVTPTPTSPAATATPTPIPAGVSIIDSAFVPQNKTIYVGETVTWANNGQLAHTTTSDSGIWNSGTLNPGQTYAHQFTSAGVFPYHCSIHPSMTGTITVLALPTLTPTPTSPSSPGTPNNCNGTCGSNYNCQGGLACYFPDPTHPNEGYCRNPFQPTSLDCVVHTATPTPTRRPLRPSATRTPTPVSYYPTPTLTTYPTTDYSQPIPEDTPTPTPIPLPTTPASPGHPLLVRIILVIGLWLLILLLIIWLIKKYRDSRREDDESVIDLANRFKTPPPTSA